ncbi:hypothetical protein [Clostridioides sp. ZZV14-6153]|uniref:hypothetical protein n=1 Tax=Clostridioides sp. ZZV14-6153 TaxID=2811494 RepID=UPI001D130251|nr:hypothetical protein [Clostridioides sp. ZZV14-6153]
MNKMLIFYDEEGYPVFQALVRNVKKYTRQNIIFELVEDYIKNNIDEIDLKSDEIYSSVSWKVWTISDAGIYNTLFDLKLDYDSLIDNKESNVDIEGHNEKNYNTGNRNAGHSNTGSYNTGNRNTGHSNKGDSNTGHGNKGDWNTGDYNTGWGNTGEWNTGNRNTRYNNIGNDNTGSYNTGNCNSGHSNIGDNNTGYCNSGNYNTGNYNIGNCNSGEWNIGDYNAGVFCTDVPKIRMFNKETDLTYEDWMNSEARNILKRNSYLTKWIRIDDMTEEEKENNQGYEINNGYLKVFSTFKEMYKDMRDSLTDEEKKIIMDIPNFDVDIFKEITGIEVI